MLVTSTLDAPLSTELELPLVAAQPGIWMADQIADTPNAYVVAQYVELTGAVDVACLDAAVRHGLAEADTVHARFVEREDGLVQVIPLQRDAAALPGLEMVDLTGEDDPVAAAQHLMRADVENCGVHGPSCRQVLIRLGAERWFWFQRYHHLMVDGFSFTAIARRMAEIYTSLRRGAPVGSSPFISFAEVVEEYRAYGGSQAEERDRRFWAEHCRDLSAPIGLSAQPGESAAGGLPLHHRVSFAPQIVMALEELGRAGSAAVSDLAMAAIVIYLHRMTGASPVWVGLPFMRRMGSVALNATGPVVNVLPMRSEVHSTMTLAQVAQGIAAELRAVRRHQRYEAEQVRRDLGLVGTNRGLYGPVLNFKLFDYRLDFDGVAGVTHQLASGPVEEMEIDLYLVDGALTIDLLGNPARYCTAELARHGHRLASLVQTLVQAPDSPVGALPLLDEAEQSLLASVNATAVPLPKATLCDLLAGQAQQSPAAVALVDGTHAVTYAETRRQVGWLARQLVAAGVRPGDRVAVALPRSVHLTLALMAVVEAGAAYLPLDTGYPDDRLAFMVEDAAPRLIITGEALRTRFAGMAPLLSYDRLADEPGEAAPLGLATPDHAAYVIYTSGSTGRPKGGWYRTAPSSTACCGCSTSTGWAPTTWCCRRRRPASTSRCGSSSGRP